MSVATFSPPIAATVKSDGTPVVVIMFSELAFGAIDQNGELVWLEPHEFAFDFRWDPVGGWGDPNAKPGTDDDL